ncbi:MAG: hypothetical protein ONB43_25580 [candidate division KSB1 bacterium]|nr:hypothetical protein [candidate division KSB1 bacterium]
MPKLKLFLFVMMTITETAGAQTANFMNKLAGKPFEQILVFEIERRDLAKIIEATAWKMNYDSVLVSALQDQIMVFRNLLPSGLQYRILLKMAPADSAVRLTAQGFWLMPPDSIPRYSKSMRAADRDLVKLFLYAAVQEIALNKGKPLYDHALPEKSFSRFMAWNLLNPGLASWYIMKDHPRTAQKSAIVWSAVFGLLDLGYIALGVLAGDEAANGRNEISAPLLDLSKRQIGFYGALTFRLAMTVGYFIDKDYQELKKSGYFFPKIEDFHFDTKYTRSIPQTPSDKNSQK